MNDVIKMAAQGDVLFRRVAKVPTGYEKVVRKLGGPLVVAHSETGHHHTADTNPHGELTAYENPTDPLVCYLQMGDVVDFTVTHHRPYDTHEPIRCLGEPGAVWEVRRQREHTPEGWRRVED